jgi:hypothetical protein
MRSTCPFSLPLPFPFPFPFPFPGPTTTNQPDALSSDVTLALKHAAVFITEFIIRCPHFNPFFSTSLPSPVSAPSPLPVPAPVHVHVPQSSSTTDHTDITNQSQCQSEDQQQKDAHQRQQIRLNAIDERIASLSTRIDEQNCLFTNRIDDCFSRLSSIQCQHTQSNSEHEILQNLHKLNDFVVDLTMKVSESSTLKNEIDELRKSITQIQSQPQSQSQSQPHSMIGFKPSLTTFQAVPATSYLLNGVIS